MSLILELAAGKALDVVAKFALGKAKKLWQKGPVERVIALLQYDFGKESGLQADDFFAWSQTDEIVEAIGEIVAGRQLAGEDAEKALAEKFAPKLYRVDEGKRPDLARRMAAATFIAAPLVLESGPAAQYVAGVVNDRMDSMEEQMAGMDSKLDVLINRDQVGEAESEVLEEEASEEVQENKVSPVPTPEQASQELPEIAQALFEAPLRRSGQLEAADRANDLLSGGDVEGAVAEMETIAFELRNAGNGSLADRYLEWAADEVEKSGGKGSEEASFKLLVDASLGQVERGSDSAQVKARRLEEKCPDGQEWIVEAIYAMDAWPEYPEEAAEVLATAAERPEPIATRFARAAVEIRALGRDFENVVRLAEKFGDMELSDSESISLKLFRLEAIEEVSIDDSSPNSRSFEQRESEWRDLELAIEKSPAEIRGMFWQRRARLLIRRGDLEASKKASTEAVLAWSEIEGGDEQAAVALIDLQTGAFLNAEQPAGWELRSLAVSARGSFESPVATAERLEAQGTESRLSGSLPDALKRWSHALLIHRRWGNLQGELRMYKRLGELRDHGGMAASALPFYIGAGEQKLAVACSALVDEDTLEKVASGWSSRWEKAVAFEVIAIEGRRLPPSAVSLIFDELAAAASEDPTGFVSPQPARSARKALAKVSLALDESDLDEALALMKQELNEPTGIDTQQAVTEALILATNVGLVDESEDLVKAFLRDSSLYRISEQWVAERVSNDSSLAALLRDEAISNHSLDAMSALTQAELVEGDVDLEAVAEQVTRESCETKTIESTTDSEGRTETSIGFGVGFEQMAVVARSASEGTRRSFVKRLLSSISNVDEPEINRTSCANALFNLGSKIPDDLRDEVGEAIAPIAIGEFELSETDADSAASQHPFSRFTFNFTNPDRLRSAALQAWSRLTYEMTVNGQSPDVPALAEAVEKAMSSGQPLLIESGLRSATYIAEVCSDAQVRANATHPDPGVRRAALSAWRARDNGLEDPIFAALVNDPSVMVRLALAGMAAEMPSGHEILRRLVDDPDSYVRRLAEKSASDSEG